jgi:hypothetical protein
VAPHRFRAGASFTPSPVMPVLWPSRRKHSTIKYLCSGNTCAKPSAGKIKPADSMRCGGALPSFPSMGKFTAVWMLVPMPSCRAVSIAIIKWSPVIIFTPTPYAMALWMVALVSGRGGSRKVSKPKSFQSPAALVLATAMARIPRLPSRCTSASARCSMAANPGDAAQSCMITWGAPLVVLKLAPPDSEMVPSVRFTTGSKGM